MPKKETPAVQDARDALRGRTRRPSELLDLAKKLKAEKQFGLARRLLARARLEPSLVDEPALRVEIFQQSALCTYKDPDLQAEARLDQALDILRQSCESLDTTTNQETLGIIGAIYKRKWEVNNHCDRARRQQPEKSMIIQRSSCPPELVISEWAMPLPELCENRGSSCSSQMNCRPTYHGISQSQK